MVKIVNIKGSYIDMVKVVDRIRAKSGRVNTWLETRFLAGNIDNWTRVCSLVRNYS